jgi:hypothetical protein
MNLKLTFVNTSETPRPLSLAPSETELQSISTTEKSLFASFSSEKEESFLA